MKKQEQNIAAIYQYQPDYAVPPGSLLKEYLAARGLSNTEFARRCGRSAKLISEIVAGRTPVEPATAIAFEHVLGMDARIWLGLEANYRSTKAQRGREVPPYIIRTLPTERASDGRTRIRKAPRVQPVWRGGLRDGTAPNRRGADLNSRDLLNTARGLAKVGPRRPTQANLRRATSTAYYAMFHCLASSSADLLIGKTRRRSLAWHQVYRGLEHGTARKACQHRKALESLPPAILDFAEKFVDLQQKRQRADYALDSGPYRKSDVLADITTAESAIRQFEQADVEARRSLATNVLFRQRPS